MSEDTVAILTRIKHKITKVKGVSMKIARETASHTDKERFFGEANICAVIVGWINEELHKLQEGK